MNLSVEPKQIDLYEFLTESELSQYYSSIKNELKITAVHQIKYATDEDFKIIGMSRPEIRRLRKFYDKYYKFNYLSKIKRLLQNPVKRDEPMNPSAVIDVVKAPSSPSKIPNNKHIIPVDAISVNKQLGVGEFGIVQQGVWTNGTERIQVAIKCLCRERMQTNPMEFLKEAAIMHSIEHENIVRLYGVVLDTEALMLVTELAHLRSLLECLKDSDLRVSFLTVPTLCDFAMQICNGMLYLENKRLIHRDLAARNILVFSKNKVKISDFGLSRALGVGKDYYKTNFNVNLKLPIAWCAPECINFLKFTNASDVWAYAVTLWEMFSYGFQPWAAMTGQQILEAIDKPNFQRLEQPECCSKEYYALMLKCWNHDPLKRPKFSEIYLILPEMKPEQLKTVSMCIDGKKDHLAYRQGEIVTVLDKSTNSHYWRGVLNNGKTGLFNPANTVAHIDSLPCSNNRDSFVRTLERSSKRKLKTDMISSPQNDLKHTGHVGIDGAYFGDVAFLSNAQSYNHLPRQIVTPYKPSEDLEQTPLLLPPTPTSPDSTQTASGYFSEATNLILNANEQASHTTNDNLSFDFRQNSSTNKDRELSTSIFNESNPFAHSDNSFHTNDHQLLTHQTMGENFVNLGDKKLWSTINNTASSTNNTNSSTDQQESHEYHEISDDEMHGDKFDLGPSLLDEMDHMFRSMTTRADGLGPPLSPDFENVNKRNELTEMNSKLTKKPSQTGNSGNIISGTSYKSKKKVTTVKPISHKDEKILNHAIEIANEISARSMTDLVADTNSSTQSPKRKFSFRFPNLTHSSHEKDTNGQQTNGTGTLTNQLAGYSSKDRKNFSEEVKNVPDLQSTITEQHRLAYKSLVENPKQLMYLKPKNTVDIDDPLSNGTGSTSTLPRSSTNTDTQVHQEQKSATLSKLIRKSNDVCSSNESSSSPLRILRDKNFPIVKPRLKILPSVGSESINSTTLLLDNDGDSMCESPSYLQHPSYTFSQKEIKQTEITSSKVQQNNNNPLPLPPRDRNAPSSTVSQKRHVRKYPLIIPATGLQRTLDKVNQVTPVEEKTDVFPIPAIVKPQIDITQNTNDDDDDDDDDVFESEKPKSQERSSQEKCHLNDNVDQPTSSKYLKNYTKDFIENNFPASPIEKTAEQSSSLLETPKSSMNDSILSRNSTFLERTYENLEIFQNQLLKDDGADTASLHFESILENDDNIDTISPIPDDMVDGFNLFNVEKESTKSSTAHISSDLLSSISKKSPVKSAVQGNIEVKRQEFSQKFPKYKIPKNELASNALFNKIKESVEMANARRAQGKGEDDEDDDDEDDKSSDDEKTCELKKSINHVSCEDLLDFSNKKPKGKERGLESDEVRILSKVLGNMVTPESCLETLDFVEWDVHKAMKLCKLKNLFPTIAQEELFNDLEKSDWDLNQTTSKIQQQL